LIHGDAGIYRAPEGTEIRTFEYEESLRSTETMSEDELFYLRKLHFLVDFCWNIEVYKPLLRLGALYGINPIDVLVRLLDEAEAGKDTELGKFFAEFDRCSISEWFESAQDIERYFADPKNFQRLLDQEFEKLNIQFSVIALRDFKSRFDFAIAGIFKDIGSIPAETLNATANLTFALFPSLRMETFQNAIEIPSNLLSIEEGQAAAFVPARDKRKFELVESRARIDLRKIIAAASTSSLSKILNTQGISLRDLQYTVADGTRFDRAFRRAV
jgi:hypothetical protein